MKKTKAFVVAAVCLVGLGLLWNSFGSKALLAPDADTVAPAGNDGRLTRAAGGELEATNTPASPEATNTPASPEVTNTPAHPLPAPTNTPTAPESQRIGTLNHLPAPLSAPEGMERIQDIPPVAEQRRRDEAHVRQALTNAKLLRRAGVRFRAVGPEVQLSGSNPHLSTATVSIDPPALTVGEGSQFSVAVLVEGVEDLGGFEFEIGYTPSVIHVDNIALGSFPGSTGRSWSPVGPTIDNGTGVARFGGFSFGSQAGANGTGELATISFSVQQGTTGATSPLDLRNVQVVDTGGTEQNVTTQDGQVTVGGSTAIVSIDPPALTVEEGSQFSVAALAEGVEDLGGFEFELHYTPSVVHVEDIALGSFPGSTGRSWASVGPDIDNSTGIARFGGFSFGSQAGASGTGELAVLSLSAQPGTAGATSQLDLRNVQVVDTGGTEQNVTTQDGQVTVSQSPSQDTCVDLLLNSHMDVVEFGDGTGSIEYWSILFQKIYYSTQYYQSPSYSLAMVDETDGSDTYGGDAEWDYDEFGQGFQAPPNLSYMRISYSRLYADANSTDQVWSNLWTLDSEGYLDELVAYAPIGESPEGWSNRYWELDSSQLVTVSDRPLALVFDMLSDRTTPDEVVFLDDAQVQVCYTPGPAPVHLPLVVKQFASQPGPTPEPEPICSPREPDSVNQRGSLDVGATCGGSLNPTDEKDYYSVNLNGASAVRLRLFNLPSGTNWDALIYEDAAGYPLQCHIGTPGDQDKFTDACDNLNPGRSYFVLVSRGPQSAGGSYNMSLTRQ